MGENKSIEVNNVSKEDILNRLRRIEGQVKGIQRMVEEEKYCGDILTQVAAVRAAVNKVGGIILQKHSKTCLNDAISTQGSEEVINDLVNTVQKFLKFVD